MCFYIKQTHDNRSLEKRFNASVINDDEIETPNNYNAFNYPRTPIICNSNDAVIEYFQWGLVPFWANDESIKKFTLNVKIETLTERPVFKEVVNKRCLVIADGFYEWQWLDVRGKKKQKYLITLPDNELFVFGGLWSQWKDKKTGQMLNTYTIVTTEANELLSEIHNSKKRMPIILTKDNEQAWLDNEPLENFKKMDIELKAVEL